MSNIFQKLSNIFTDEVPDPVNTKPAIDMKPLVTNNTPTASTAQITNNVIVNNNYTQQPVITPEKQKQYQKYFGDIYDDVSKRNANYNTFLSNIKIVDETDPTIPIDKKIKFAYAYMKNIATKEELLSATNKVYDAIVADRTQTFDKEQAQKTTERVDNKSKLILDKQNAIAIKQQEIAALTDEINKLNIEINNNKENLSINVLCYNTYSEQLLNKIKQDIQFIQNYI
jgi:hypothetical protein